MLAWMTDYLRPRPIPDLPVVLTADEEKQEVEERLRRLEARVRIIEETVRVMTRTTEPEAE